MHFDLEQPEHAYLLGFLLGDGHLYAGCGQKGRLGVELHVRDRDLLERFLELLPGATLSTRIRTTNFSRGPYETAVLSCSGLAVRSALKAIGMPEGRKGDSVRPPQVPYSLRDFARGLCDADGSLGLTGQGQPFISLVTSSPALADWWCAKVVPMGGVQRSWKPNKRDGVANIMLAVEPAQRLTAWMYQPGDLALERKAGAAVAMQAWTRPQGMRRAYTAKRWTPDEDEIVLQDLPLSELAVLLGRTVQSVNLRRWRLKKVP